MRTFHVIEKPAGKLRRIPLDKRPDFVPAGFRVTKFHPNIYHVLELARVFKAREMNARRSRTTDFFPQMSHWYTTSITRAIKA